MIAAVKPGKIARHSVAVLIQLKWIYQLGFSSSLGPIGGHTILQHDWLILLNSIANYLHQL